LIGSAILGCDASIDQAIERSRLAELVSPVPSAIEIAGKQLTKDGSGELWLSISSDRIGPLPPAVASSTGPVRLPDSIRETKIPREIVLSIAEQLEVSLPQLGKPLGLNAWIRELTNGSSSVRIRDLQMDGGWLTVTERLPGETGAAAGVAGPSGATAR